MLYVQEVNVNCRGHCAAATVLWCLTFSASCQVFLSGYFYPFQIRAELEMQMVCDLGEFKKFIGNEMIVILGQMDSPTEIFEHVYLVRTTWFEQESHSFVVSI